MKNIIDKLHLTREHLVVRARKVSSYFANGGGQSTGEPIESPRLAWTSEDQKQRSKEFHELATKLAKKNRAA